MLGSSSCDKDVAGDIGRLNGQVQLSLLEVERKRGAGDREIYGRDFGGVTVRNWVRNELA